MSELGRMLRQRCSFCDSSSVEWLSLGDARVLGLPVDEAVDALGVVESVWRCADCGECGFFGPDFAF